jgi:hypothetical protein
LRPSEDARRPNAARCPPPIGAKLFAKSLEIALKWNIFDLEKTIKLKSKDGKREI